MLGGKIFQVTFTKKNGELRKMTCRLGVKKGQKTGAPSTTAHIPQYLTVFDMKIQQYRNINIQKLTYFKCGDNAAKLLEVA